MFEPLPISALVETDDSPHVSGQHEAISHTSGQVFDIDYASLPAAEVECLKFVLEDLGWEGYLGFIEDGTAILHIGPSPDSREFFASVFQETVGKKTDETVAQ
jgi:hypothetical protein